MNELKQTKSDRTKAKIEAAARGLFREQGYEQTTVRDIAAAAAIDPAMIIRYFKSKEALFDRVAEPDLQLPELSALDAADVGRVLITRFLELWETGEAGGGMTILLRSAACNEAAAIRLQTIFAKQVVPALAGIGDPSTASLRAGLISSQLLGLAFTRYVLKLPPVVAAGRDTLIREVGATIQRYATL